MSETPKMSFVMPTHNRIEWLPLAIDSLRSQTEKDIEIVVVNDASTDGTDGFLDEWMQKEPRLTVLHNMDPRGAGPSRNKGAEIAKADIIAVCDDDDVYINTRAENILKWFAEHPDSELVTFPYVSIDYFENVVESYAGQPFDHDAFKARGEVSYYCNPATAYRKAAALAVGGYKREGEGITDDYQFLQNWVGAGKRVDYCGNIGDEVPFATMHRILPNSMMAKIRGFDPAWLRKAQ